MSEQGLVSGVAVFLFGENCVYLKTTGANESSLLCPIIKRAMPGCGSLLELAEAGVAAVCDPVDTSDLLHILDCELDHGLKMMISVYAAWLTAEPRATKFQPYPLDQAEKAILGAHVHLAATVLIGETVGIDDSAG